MEVNYNDFSEVDDSIALEEEDREEDRKAQFWAQLNRYQNNPTAFARAFWRDGDYSVTERINILVDNYPVKISRDNFEAVYDFASDKNKINIINKSSEKGNYVALKMMKDIETDNKKYSLLDLAFIPFRHINGFWGILGCITAIIALITGGPFSPFTAFATLFIGAASAYGYYRSHNLSTAKKRLNMINNDICKLNRENENFNNRGREPFLGDNGRASRAMEIHRQMNQGENQHNQNQINQPLLNI